MRIKDGVDRLAILIVSGRQADELMGQLTEHGFSFTVINSSGGMLQEAMVSLFVGVHQLRLPALLTLVRATCRPETQYVPAHLHFQPGVTPIPMIEARVGGALVFVLDVERFVQI